MPRDADFAGAHRRHWNDAELLYRHQRWANADQLYGFSAECGLKAVMRSLGMPVDTTGTPERKYLKHLPDLWPIFQDFAKGRDGGQYLDRLPIREPFADWSHHDRYAHSEGFSRATLEPHRDAARGIRQMVATAEQDGNS